MPHALHTPRHDCRHDSRLMLSRVVARCFSGGAVLLETVKKGAHPLGKGGGLGIQAVSPNGQPQYVPVDVANLGDPSKGAARTRM